MLESLLVRIYISQTQKPRAPTQRGFQQDTVSSGLVQPRAATMILCSSMSAFKDMTSFRPLFHPLSFHELSNEIIDATSQVGKKMAKDSILHGCTKNWVTLAYMHFQKVVYSDRLLYLQVMKQGKQTRVKQFPTWNRVMLGSFGLVPKTGTRSHLSPQRQTHGFPHRSHVMYADPEARHSYSYQHESQDTFSRNIESNHCEY